MKKGLTPRDHDKSLFVRFFIEIFKVSRLYFTKGGSYHISIVKTPLFIDLLYYLGGLKKN